MGGLPYQELSDFHPKGQVSQAYDVWNDERGVSIRSVFIVDKGGTIRYRKTYSAPNLPDMEEIIGEVEKLG
jgi:alkyl hydroperoxide reductase subunit AhpC